ncbi:MAG: aldehyde ferredoxin oxidoreductase N-terminal domain-containing protein [Patescibacteria group bacterium]
MGINKVILHIDLTKRLATTKSYDDIHKFVGGVGFASFLTKERLDFDPVVFSVGPLNGFFPFVSKTCASFVEDFSFHDVYVGGKLSTRLQFSSFDAIVLEGSAKAPVVISIAGREVNFYNASTDPFSVGTPGKRCVMSVDSKHKQFLTDGVFAFGGNALSEKLQAKGVVAITVSGTEETQTMLNPKYEKLYLEILSKVKMLLIEPSNNASCSGCPMGCKDSKVGESGGDVFTHCLVACKFADPIYSDLSLVFACLNTLGYDYNHGDLENLPILVNSTTNFIYEKLSNSKLETK